MKEPTITIEGDLLYYQIPVEVSRVSEWQPWKSSGNYRKLLSLTQHSFSLNNFNHPGDDYELIADTSDICSILAANVPPGRMLEIDKRYLIFRKNA